eukprot:scaffold27586_cov22-Prasinocladus_malaysianus.AAC.1
MEQIPSCDQETTHEAQPHGSAIGNGQRRLSPKAAAVRLGGYGALSREDVRGVRVSELLDPPISSGLPGDLRGGRALLLSVSVLKVMPKPSG